MFSASLCISADVDATVHGSQSERWLPLHVSSRDSVDMVLVTSLHFNIANWEDAEWSRVFLNKMAKPERKVSSSRDPVLPHGH